MRLAEPLQFVFAFVEDGTLEVFASPKAAVREFEGIDVESGTVKFYDGNGIFLKPVFSTPNRTGKLLGLVSWVRSGVYDLVPSPESDEDPFALALHEVRAMEANPWFPTIEQVKSALAQRGVLVEWKEGQERQRSET